MAKKISLGGVVALDGEKEFRAAITGINSDMKVLASEMKKVSAEFLDNKDSVEALTAKDEVLNKQLDTQKEKVEALKKALENSVQQYGENDTKTDQWKISLNNAEAELSKLTKEVKDNNDALESAKNPTDNIADGIKEFGDNADDAGQKALSMGDLIKANLISTAIIDGVKNLASSIASLASEALESADSIQQMSDQTGLSAEKVQELSYVGDTLGVSIDTITGSYAKLINNMSSASEGSGKAYEAFQKLGVSVTDSNGNLRDAQTVWQEAVTALGNVSNETEATAIAQDLFGKSASDLNPLINASTEELSKLSQQAYDTGAIMSGDTVSSLDDFGDTMGQLKTTITGIAGSILNELMPSIEPLIAEVQESAPAIAETVGNIASKVGELIKWLVVNGDLVISVIAGIAAGMLAWNVISMVTGVVEAIKAFQLANEGATIAQYALNLAMNANPIGIIITAVTGLIAIIGTLWATNEDFRDGVLGIFDKIKEGFSDAWDAISTFVTKTIPDAFNKFIGWIKDNWQGLLLLLVNPFAGAFKLIYDNCDVFRETVDKFVTKIKALVTTLFNNMVAGIKDLPDKFAETGKNTVKFLWNAINGLNDWIVGKIVGFGGNILGGITNGISGIADIGLNLVKGLWNGINNATDWIIDKIGGFTDSVVGSIKDFFGIHSPSTVFRDEVGTYLAQGLGEGFTSEMDSITNDMINSIPTDFSINGSYNMSAGTTGYISGVSNSNGLDYDKLTSAVVNALNRLNPQVILSREKVGEFVWDTINKEVFA